jgi:hypothetical protein
MGHKIGIAGIPNSGKSFSRRTIPDGENTFLLIPSMKATHIKDSKGIPLKPFNVQTPSFKDIDAAITASPDVGNVHQLVSKWNAKLPLGSFKQENLTGNIQLIENLADLPIWLKFISKHLPWVHTVLIPDFGHYIGRVISDDAFIQRKAGGEAYQRFWELAAHALKNFVIVVDSLRHDLVVVTEYHAVFDEALGGYDIFVPAGKMLSDKFLIPSYYDILVFTDVKINNEGEDNENAEYRFVTRPTRRYPYARTMNLYESTYVPNDLQELLTRTRDYLGIPWKPPVKEKAKEAVIK